MNFTMIYYSQSNKTTNANLTKGRYFMQVFVVDAMTGAGKSCGAIRYMNEGDGKYIYVTPYLTEVERIVEACKEKEFCAPEDDGAKLSSVRKLISEGRNIATTHALFGRFTRDIVGMLKEGGYTLILDEVFEIVKRLSVSRNDIEFLLSSGIFKLEDDGCTMSLSEGAYVPEAYKQLAAFASENRLILIKQCAMFWTFPAEIFKAFKEVIILTYMFESQLQSYYFTMNNIQCGRKYVDKDELGFKIVDYEVPENQLSLGLIDKIHIVNERKYNEVGDRNNALSKAWFSRHGTNSKEITELRRQMGNMITNRFRGVKGSVMWTTLKQNRKKLTSKGFVKSFVPCNARGTNMYSDATRLVYCLNVFVNPFIMEYFRMHGVEVDQDKYALSEIIQWVYRSAIRKGEDIWI